jgi:hypothetical protein
MDRRQEQQETSADSRSQDREVSGRRKPMLSKLERERKRNGIYSI